MLQTSVNALASLLERCNKIMQKDSQLSSSSTIPSATHVKLNRIGLPPRTQTGSVPTVIATQTACKNKEVQKTGTKGDASSSLASYDDEDVEMVSEEMNSSDHEQDASTTAVLQVFQSVGETVFDKR